LLDLEASKQPSGGDGSIGEVCPGCASATMPAWSQPRRRLEYRQWWRLCGMVMLLSIFASVGDIPSIAAEFSAVAQTTALVERHSGARVTEERACR